MAQSKITKIEDKTFQGKVTRHVIYLEDGTEGYLNDKDSDNLTVGDIADYTFEKKERKSKKGEFYNLLTLKRAVASTPEAPLATQPKDHSPIPKITLFQEKVKGVLKSMELTMEAVYNNKITYAQAQGIFKEIKNDVLDAIDEVASEI